MAIDAAGTLSESAHIVLGAFAMADVHTLTAADVLAMAAGALDAELVGAAMGELVAAGCAEPLDTGSQGAPAGCRLTRAGLELAFEIQTALAGKPGG